MALGFTSSRGGACPPFDPLTGRQIRQLEAHLQALRQGDVSAETLEAALTEGAWLRELDLYVNDRCNLSCSHCYVSFPRLATGYLQPEHWLTVLDEAEALHVRYVAVIGMEPTLVWPLTLQLLNRMRTWAKRDTSLRFGIVSNGISLKGKKLEEYLAQEPHFLDLSIDGTENTHDRIRGAGAFAKVSGTVHEALRRPHHTRVVIGCTLNEASHGEMPHFLDMLGSWGVSRVTISPFVEADQPESWHQLSQGRFRATTERILDHLCSDKLAPSEVYLRTSESSATQFAELWDAGIVTGGKIVQDQLGQLFSVYEFRHSRLLIDVSPLPAAYFRALRIGPTGLVSSCEDMFHRDYVRRAVGSIKEFTLRDICRSTAVQTARRALCGDFVRRFAQHGLGTTRRQPNEGAVASAVMASLS